MASHRNDVTRSFHGTYVKELLRRLLRVYPAALPVPVSVLRGALHIGQPRYCLQDEPALPPPLPPPPVALLPPSPGGLLHPLFVLPLLLSVCLAPRSTFSSFSRCCRCRALSAVAASKSPSLTFRGIAAPWRVLPRYIRLSGKLHVPADSSYCETAGLISIFSGISGPFISLIAASCAERFQAALARLGNWGGVFFCWGIDAW